MESIDLCEADSHALELVRREERAKGKARIVEVLTQALEILQSTSVTQQHAFLPILPIISLATPSREMYLVLISRRPLDLRNVCFCSRGASATLWACRTRLSQACELHPYRPNVSFQL